MEPLLQEIGTPLIAVIVPIIVFAVRKIIPVMPKAMLPVLAGAFGPMVEAVLTWMGNYEFTGVAGVAMGLAGVGVRELKKQVGAVLRSSGGTVSAAWPATVTAVMLALLLTSCAGMMQPQTPRERLVLAEEEYQALLMTVSDFTERGLITTENRVPIRGAIVAARTALDAWHVNPDSPDAMSAALATLRAIQSILDTLEQKRATSSADPPLLVPWYA